MSLLLFSIGILGLVGLQASMTKAQSAAKYRADATYLASELVGALWVDKVNLADYATTPTATCTAGRCVDWVNKVSSGLPGGAATVAVTPATGTVLVTLSWSVSNEGTNSYVCPPQSDSRPARRGLGGFSLIELMVGIAIGLIATLIVTQVLLASEGQKRTTTSGSDAQVSGALALDALHAPCSRPARASRPIPTPLGCTLEASFNGAAVPGFPISLAPANRPTPGDAGAADTIRVLGSGKSSYSLPLRIVVPGYNPGNAARPAKASLSPPCAA